MRCLVRSDLWHPGTCDCFWSETPSAAFAVPAPRSPGHEVDVPAQTAR